MKICQLCAVDFTLYHFLLPLMERLRERGHDVVAVCSDGPLIEPVRQKGFRVETVDFSRSLDPLAHWRTYRKLLPVLRCESFDMLHSHTPVASVVGRLAAWRAGVPRLVYTAHGFYFHEHMPWPKRALFIAIEWLAGRVTDLLLTQSAEDAATAKRLGLCASGRVAAIGNGVDPDLFQPADTASAVRASRQQLDLPAANPNQPVIAMIGRLVAEKGYLELIEAMRSVEATLWIIGERLDSDHAGDVGVALQACRDDPVLANRIRSLGYRQDVPQVLQAADIFVLPSHREGMPRSIIEAMMTGLPVVATDIRGSRELVVDGETGLLVPVRRPTALADALRRLVNDEALRRKMGVAGRSRALRLYDENKVIDRQIDLLGL